MANKPDEYFFTSQNDRFSGIGPQDDFLHPEQNKLVSADSLTETQYFGFHIAEKAIHGICYLWHHPNLHVVTGGLFVWQGINSISQSAEIFDIRDFMSDRVLKNDLHAFRLDNGYGAAVIEPLKRHHVTYSDPVRNNHLDLRTEAASPPIMFSDGNHFEQCLHVRGELILRGERHQVDCFSVRDRSWGRPRPEDNMPMPPISWMSGGFGEDLTFNCNMLDEVDASQEANKGFVLPPEKLLNGGWLYRDGKVGRVVRAKKLVQRESRTHLPKKVELQIWDDQERSMSITGTLLAACHWPIWSNFHFVVCLMRWESEGRVAYGDCQEGFWHDYLRAHAKQDN